MQIQKQRNVCVKKAKKDYDQNIDINNLTDSEKLWKTMERIFGSKKI